MKIVSINSRGVGLIEKKNWIRSIARKEKPDFIGIQETKTKSWEISQISKIWGDDMDFVEVGAIGNSGGIVSIWDKKKFICEFVICETDFLAVIGSWEGVGGPVGFVNVYGPNSNIERRTTWHKLTRLLSKKEVRWCIFGDFNEVRTREERLNTWINMRGMVEFNEFIEEGGLIELPLSGRKYTRISDDGTKFSKLD